MRKTVTEDLIIFNKTIRIKGDKETTWSSVMRLPTRKGTQARARARGASKRRNGDLRIFLQPYEIYFSNVYFNDIFLRRHISMRHIIIFKVYSCEVCFNRVDFREVILIVAFVDGFWCIVRFSSLEGKIVWILSFCAFGNLYSLERKYGVAKLNDILSKSSRIELPNKSSDGINSKSWKYNNIDLMLLWGGGIVMCTGVDEGELTDTWNIVRQQV